MNRDMALPFRFDGRAMRSVRAERTSAKGIIRRGDLIRPQIWHCISVAWLLVMGGASLARDRAKSTLQGRTRLDQCQ
jgi:hypothetical protein